MPRALITGANRGIGLALAKAARQRGFEVIGTHRGPPPALAGAEWRGLDLRQAAQISAFSGRVQGPLDLLICNAGVLPTDDGDPAAWAEAFAVNVTANALLIEGLRGQLAAAGGKVAILASNMGSSARAPGGHLIYRASKAAVLNLGRNLATDLRPQGIAVGIYHPGWVRTDMGGQGAEIAPEASAEGLMQRIAALSLATSGAWEDWQGQALRF